MHAKRHTHTQMATAILLLLSQSRCPFSYGFNLFFVFFLYLSRRCLNNKVKPRNTTENSKSCAGMLLYINVWRAHLMVIQTIHLIHIDITHSRTHFAQLRQILMLLCSLYILQIKQNNHMGHARTSHTLVLAIRSRTAPLNGLLNCL